MGVVVLAVGFAVIQPGSQLLAQQAAPSDGAVSVYNFALHPEQHQPSGTTNLNRIDNTQTPVRNKKPTSGITNLNRIDNTKRPAR